MPAYCMVVKCGSNSARDAGISFFRIPSITSNGGKIMELAKTRRDKWLSALKRDDLTESKIKYGRICSRHFHSGKPAKLHDKDNPDWLPTKLMGHRTSVQVHNPERYERLAARRERNKIVAPPPNEPPEVEENHVTNHEELSVEQLQLALRTSNEQIYNLREEIKNYKLDREFFQTDKHTVYYTGLAGYSYLKCIVDVIEPHLTSHSNLSQFQQIILTLMKLRLDLPFTDLGYRFQCHQTTAARTFYKVIEVLYGKLQSLVMWPDRKYLQMNMPQSFIDVFGLKPTVIIDCFEVFIEKPGNLEASAKTFSHYKHHHTMKFLIGISPQGAIIYISNAYGGRASDKYITENCGFLEKLMKGDLVIADRGFTIEDSVNLYCAEVKCPAFLKGKKQLSAKEIEQTRKLASIRIHVERVIGLLKTKYKIFHGVFPIASLKIKEDEFALVDKIMIVCCALINLCPSIIPLD